VVSLSGTSLGFGHNLPLDLSAEDAVLHSGHRGLISEHLSKSYSGAGGSKQFSLGPFGPSMLFLDLGISLLLVILSDAINLHHSLGKEERQGLDQFDKG